MDRPEPELKVFRGQHFPFLGKPVVLISADKQEVRFGLTDRVEYFAFFTHERKESLSWERFVRRGQMVPPSLRTDSALSRSLGDSEGPLMDEMDREYMMRLALQDAEADVNHRVDWFYSRRDDLNPVTGITLQQVSPSYIVDLFLRDVAHAQLQRVGNRASSYKLSGLIGRCFDNGEVLEPEELEE